jgi:hypothetical protein
VEVLRAQSELASVFGLREELEVKLNRKLFVLIPSVTVGDLLLVDKATDLMTVTAWYHRVVASHRATMK